MADLTEAVKGALGRRVLESRRLGGSGWAAAMHLTLDDGSEVVSKASDGAYAGLAVEARMLRYLREHSPLPTPAVLHADERLLIMEFLPGRGPVTPEVERHAAEVLASCHAVTSDQYGLEFDTVIGPLPQPNARADSWPEFFRDQRLLPFARAARDGGLSQRTLGRIERLASRLGELLPQRPAASLMHGDVWSGNVLSDGRRLTGLIDPAVYHGHAEVELAFIDLFHTFGEAFYAEYRSRSTATAADWREYERTRRTLYNLYPLLVHTACSAGHTQRRLNPALRHLAFETARPAQVSRTALTTLTRSSISTPPSVNLMRTLVAPTGKNSRPPR